MAGHPAGCGSNGPSHGTGERGTLTVRHPSTNRGDRPGSGEGCGSHCTTNATVARRSHPLPPTGPRPPGGGCRAYPGPVTPLSSSSTHWGACALDRDGATSWAGSSMSTKWLHEARIAGFHALQDEFSAPHLSPRR